MFMMKLVEISSSRAQLALHSRGILLGHVRHPRATISDIYLLIGLYTGQGMYSWAYLYNLKRTASNNLKEFELIRRI